MTESNHFFETFSIFMWFRGDLIAYVQFHIFFIFVNKYLMMSFIFDGRLDSTFSFSNNSTYHHGFGDIMFW